MLITELFPSDQLIMLTHGHFITKPFGQIYSQSISTSFHILDGEQIKNNAFNMCTN